MCTLVLAWEVFAEAPVAVAANRDESTDRPSTPPGIFRENPSIVAPRDAEAGGTWIGYNDSGVFVGVTNRWLSDELESDRSRGLLVADALACESTAAATALVERETTERRYDGFNLVVADAENARYLEWDGALTTTALDPGVHVVVNVGRDGGADVPAHRRKVGEQQADNAERVQRALEPDLDVRTEPRVNAWLDRAGGVLGDHEYGVCIHGDGFGTRSSSLIALGESQTYRYAGGPPCVTEYEFVETESHI